MSGISKRIKDIRGNTSQDEFASLLGSHKNTIGRWERGERIPGHDDLSRILTVYPDINPTWLLTGDGPMRKVNQDQVRESLTEYTTDIPWDARTMTDIIEAIEEVLQEAGEQLIPTEKAKVIIKLYEGFKADSAKVDKSEIRRSLRLVV